jgi:ubiquinone/menaquinone biosynthesis C-methylase UbiE
MINSMGGVENDYLPAAGYDWALPFYDPFLKLLGVDMARKSLLDQAALQPHHRVLDIGCGTGTMAICIKRLYPDVGVIGLDPDPKALVRARNKAKRSEVPIKFDRGFSNDLPYADATFDRVLSSFMFHHLGAKEKAATLREVRRVLKPDGSLHLLDFAAPDAPAHRGLARLLHSSQHLKENIEGRILSLMSQAGFLRPKKVTDKSMLFGLLRIGYFQASMN